MVLPESIVLTARHGVVLTGNVHTKPGASGGSGMNGVHYTAHTGEAIIGPSRPKRRPAYFLLMLQGNTLLPF